jgi:hypothetical protein
MGEHSTAGLPLPTLEYREEDSYLFLKLKEKAKAPALYYEHIPEKDPRYIDEHGVILPHTPDWAILLDDEACLVELERATLSQQLWYSIKKNRLPQFKLLRKELLSTILRHKIAQLRHRHVEGSPLPFLLARPELKESLRLPKGDDRKIPDQVLLDHLEHASAKYILHIFDLLDFHFPSEASFIYSVLADLDRFSENTEKLAEEQLLQVFQKVIQEQREACNFKDDPLTIQNELWNLHFKTTYSDSSRLNSKHLKYQ